MFVDIPNLYMIETIDSIKLATAVDVALQQQTVSRQLKVMVQVNTSSEDSKIFCINQVILNQCSVKC